VNAAPTALAKTNAEVPNGVVVLDSWAVLRYLEGVKPASTRVADLLEQTRPVMSWMNLGEVFYVLRRAFGEDEAATTVRDLREVIAAELPDAARILSAARFKSDFPLSYADAFAAATTVAHEAVLYTGDPELLVPSSPWSWVDLR
jgi:predicted nucleic acid-binding protein